MPNLEHVEGEVGTEVSEAEDEAEEVAEDVAEDVVAEVVVAEDVVAEDVVAEDVVAEVVVHMECWKVISVRGMCQMNMMCLNLNLNLLEIPEINCLLILFLRASSIFFNCFYQMRPLTRL